MALGHKKSLHNLYYMWYNQDRYLKKWTKSSTAAHILYTWGILKPKVSEGPSVNPSYIYICMMKELSLSRKQTGIIPTLNHFQVIQYVRHSITLSPALVCIYSEESPTMFSSIIWKDSLRNISAARVSQMPQFPEGRMNGSLG